MVRKITFLALFLLAGAAIFTSCKKEELSGKKEVLAFIFEASKNAQLGRNFLGDINETNISAEVAFAVDLTQLVPTIEISPRATISPESGILTDFSGPVVYTVTAEDGSTKVFTATVAAAPAPYIGSWSGGPIDFGLGLMRISANITEDGEITLEFTDIMNGEKNAMSLKGMFNPNSRQDTEIRLDQTHRWSISGWVADSCCKTFMYHVNNAQNIRVYFCEGYPRSDEWCFQINLTKD
jgi:hypothetical protein